MWYCRKWRCSLVGWPKEVGYNQRMLAGQSNSGTYCEYCNFSLRDHASVCVIIRSHKLTYVSDGHTLFTSPQPQPQLLPLRHHLLPTLSSEKLGLSPLKGMDGRGVNVSFISPWLSDSDFDVAHGSRVEDMTIPPRYVNRESLLCLYV